MLNFENYNIKILFFSHHILYFRVCQLFPDNGVHLVLHGSGLLHSLETERAQCMVELTDLRHRQLLNKVQHRLYVHNVVSCDYHVTTITYTCINIMWCQVTNLDEYAESLHGFEIVF